MYGLYLRKFEALILNLLFSKVKTSQGLLIKGNSGGLELFSNRGRWKLGVVFQVVGLIPLLGRDSVEISNAAWPYNIPT